MYGSPPARAQHQRRTVRLFIRAAATSTRNSLAASELGVISAVMAVETGALADRNLTDDYTGVSCARGGAPGDRCLPSSLLAGGERSLAARLWAGARPSSRSTENNADTIQIPTAGRGVVHSARGPWGQAASRPARAATPQG